MYCCLLMVGAVGAAKRPQLPSFWVRLVCACAVCEWYWKGGSEMVGGSVCGDVRMYVCGGGKMQLATRKLEIRAPSKRILYLIPFLRLDKA